MKWLRLLPRTQGPRSREDKRTQFITDKPAARTSQGLKYLSFFRRLFCPSRCTVSVSSSLRWSSFQAFGGIGEIWVCTLCCAGMIQHMNSKGAGILESS